MTTSQLELDLVLREHTLRQGALPRLRRRGWLIRRMLLAADLIGLTLAYVLAQLVVPPPVVADAIAPHVELVLFLCTLPVWMVVAKLYGLYDRDEERADHSTADELVDVLHVVTVGTWLLFAGASLTNVADPHLGRLAAFWALAIAFATTGRATARAFARRQIAYVQNTVIVGAGDIGQAIAEKALRHPEYGLNLVGFVDADPRELSDDLAHVAVLGTPEQLPGLIDLLDVERVVIAFSGESDERTLELIRSLKDTGVQIAIVPRLFELVSPNVGIHTIEGIPMLGLPPLGLSRSSAFLKRATDVVVSSLALVVLSPLLLAIAIAVRRSSPGPVLFSQLRVGESGVPFRILKFRTMVENADDLKDEVRALNMHARSGRDARMFKIPVDPRVTPIGGWLRRWSLDELPQLVNVLRGEMSLVGPRPLILEEARHVDDWGRTRLNLRPGITGLWQVLGRSEITFDEMIKLDYLYVTSWSLAGDLRLLLKTLPIVARGSGSY